jgi:valyl-tRNA synthetase
MASVFDTPYNPKEHEESIYQLWEKSGFFDPDTCVEKGITQQNAPYFSVALPPPNVTGTLHLGHAFEHTLQDIMVRYHRMKGERTLWVPGTDHAAIATQSKYEKELYKKEHKSRHDFPREEFFDQVNQFAIQNQNKILNQLKKIGDSVDWSRLAFTLDEKRERAVRTVFKKMYDDGIIYRGNRIVNWDPKGQTTISDDEVVHEETDAMLYTFRYSKEFPILIATTRPETKVGDVAVAVHPDDARHKEFVGKTYSMDFVGVPLEIKIVADKEIDPAYGTGAVGITPAHSMVDWEIAERHNLPFKKVINEFAKMENVSEELNGKKTLEAREIIVQKLRDAGLLEKEEKIKNNISKAERTGGVIEPLPKLQWFVDVNKKFKIKNSKLKEIPSGSETTLKEIMQKTVASGEITIIPDHFRKIYEHWVNNLKDWCISRQILYGHRVPVWYNRRLGGPNQAKHFDKNLLLKKLKMSDEEFHKNTFEWQELPDYMHLGGSSNIQIGMSLLKELKDRDLLNDEWIKQNEITQPTWQDEQIYCDIEAPKDIGWEQDSDTLDTWFSSALWTFSTLGWPNETDDLKNYHPTSVINPGYEILSLWVSRMIMMSGYCLGEAPFRFVYFHGIVRDKDGRKFSKSLNNGIDPIEVIDSNGTDALRMSLTVGIGPGSDVQFDLGKVKGYKHFANKIWNATRYVLQNTENVNLAQKPKLTDEDEKRFIELNTIIKDVTEDMDNFRFYLAAEKIYHYFWHTFADKIIEESKANITKGSEEEKISKQWLVREILETSLKLLHPFMPFVTEAIWQEVHQGKSILMIEKWPTR